tara:strand:+ start:1552 stop:2229 length:678 start_codon:yes stop_codon:yes gene_type:complete
MSYIPTILKNIDFINVMSSYKNKNDKNNSQVLDPLSSLIRLALLNFKPVGTKLSFLNNTIYFQEPDLLQSAKRWSSGDNRNQIHNLYNPIFKIHQWYDITKSEFIFILNTAKSGLQKLIQCYDNDSSTISHSINYYIETIDNILNDTIKKDDLENTTDIYSLKLKDLWTDREIQIIYLLLLDIDEKHKSQNKFNNSESLINAIEQILLGKDKFVYNIVNKISTSL